MMGRSNYMSERMLQVWGSSTRTNLQFACWFGLKKKDALLSVDASNRIFLYRIQKSADKGWLNDPVELFKTRLDSEKAITDVSVGEAAAKILVSTRESDHLFDLNDSKSEMERTHHQIPVTRKWFPHPQSAQHLICVDNAKICAHNWCDLTEVSSVKFQLGDQAGELTSASLYSLGQEHRIMLHLVHPRSSTKTNRMAVINLEHLHVQGSDIGLSQGKQIYDLATITQCTTDEDKGDISKPPNLAAALYSRVTQFELDIAHFIGVDDSSKRIFLNQSCWVCSVDLSASGLDITQHEGDSSIEVSEHFFIPHDWFAGEKDIVCVLAKGDVALTRGGDLAVIRGGVEYNEAAFCTVVWTAT